MITEITERFAAAGADLLSTNTFNATAISQADYGMESLAYELNRAAAAIARAVADRWTAREPHKPRFVIGALGPTNKTASLSPDVNDPGFRDITFAQLATAYRTAAEGCIDGGCDLLAVETIFDTLNAKAALYAIDELLLERDLSMPVMVSGTITDASGRTLSGQTPTAFWHSVQHIQPFTIGLNCALGAEQMRPHIEEIAGVAETWVCAYPNAGLPNEMGEYDVTPHDHASELRQWARDGLVNIVGGCCGTTPEHIAEIAQAVAGVAPRVVPVLPRRLRLSGLEALTV